MSLIEQFGHLAIPRESEPGFRSDPLVVAIPLASEVFLKAMRLWEDPDLAPLLAREVGLVDLEREDGDLDWERDDLPTLLGVPWLSVEDALLVFEVVLRTQTYGAEFAFDLGYKPPSSVPVAIVAGILVDASSPGLLDKPRLVLVSKDQAKAFVEKHHSKLRFNPLGLMYALGVRVGSRIVAVATVGHPTAPYGRRCDPRNVLELTRIASDGTTRGASSMLASRAMDLLPFSGRGGFEPLLFVTYSLVSEAGTTYASLIDKGLRPVAMNVGKKPSGARAGAGLAALPQLPKIAWEAGPIANPPDWDAMVKALRFSDPEKITSLEAQGRVQEANKLRSTSPESRVATMRARFSQWEAREAKAIRKGRKAAPTETFVDPSLTSQVMEFRTMCDALRSMGASEEAEELEARMDAAKPGWRVMFAP